MLKESEMYLYILLLVVNFFKVQGTECPLWTSEEAGVCKCGKNLREIVQCQDNKGVQQLFECFCMTTTEGNNSLPLVGSCPYTCKVMYNTYLNITTNTSLDLNKKTCGLFYRTGVLCSKCIEGYGLPVYSYNLSCVNCTNYKYNWIKYVAVAYGPLTLFYIAAVIFRISATSGLMICYVTICQMLTIRGLVLWLTNLKQDGNHNFISITKFLVTLSSMWNLDFFRSLHSPFCLHPTISALHVLLLDYLVAVYPLILILITYSLVKLHDRYTLVVWFCKPLYICFHKFRKEWDIKTSLVASFATFYLLSYVKIINVTADILTPTYYYDIKGERSELYFYYNASIMFFGKEHLPHAAFAIIFSFLFNVCPLLLLCLYPCTCFHKCLNKTGCRCHTLHVFMDALLGSFSHKPRERRHFGALYLNLRIIHVILFSLHNPFIYITLACYMVLAFIATMAICLPYRKSLHNKVDLVLLSSLACMYLSVLLQHEGTGTHNLTPKRKFTVILSCIFSTVPLYGIGMLIKTTVPKRLMKRIKTFIYNKITRRRELEESLPYQLEYGERKALLA